MKLLRGVTDRIFGFDVFISYSRSDGTSYASKLESALGRSGFRCFLDSKEMPPGEGLQTSLQSALKRSSVLVLVVSPGAVRHSVYMPREFDHYLEFRKQPKIVPISIGRTLDDAPADLALIQRLRGKADVIWIPEEEDRLPIGPSKKVIGTLVESFRFTRRNTIRNRVVSSVATVLAVLLVVAVLLGLRSEQQRRKAQRTLSEADYQQAASASRSDRDEEALAFLARAIENDPTNEMAASRLLCLLLYRNWPVEKYALDHGAPLISGEFSPDGRQLLTADNNGDAKIWNAADGEKIHTLAHGQPLRKAAFSPDGTKVVTAGGNTVRLWDSGSGKQVGQELNLDHPVTDLAFQPAGTVLAIACAGPAPESSEEGSEDEPSPPPGYVRLFDGTTFEPTGPRLREGHGATHIAWHPNVPWLALGIGKTIQLWDAKTNQPRFPAWELGSYFSPLLSSVGFDRSGDLLMASCGTYADGSVSEAGIDAIGYARLWDTRDGKVLVPEQEPDSIAARSLFCESWVRDAVIVEPDNPEGIKILTAADNGEANIWLNLLEGKDPGRFEAPRQFTASHEIPVEKLLPGRGSNLATLANNRATGFGYARRWSEGTGFHNGIQPASQRIEHQGLVTGVDCSPDGSALLTVGDDGIARVWWTATTEVSGEDLPAILSENNQADAPPVDAVEDEHPAPDPSDDPSPEADSTKSFGIELAADIPMDGEELAEPIAKALRAVATNQDPNRTKLPVKIGNDEYLVFLSPDNRWLVSTRNSGERDPGEAVLWNVATRKRVGRLATELPVQDVAFAGSSDRFAVASGFNMAGIARSYRTQNLEPLGPPFSGPGKPIQLGFSPDGTRLAVGFSTDPMENGSRIGVFDVAKGLPLIETRFDAASGTTIRFQPDGQRLLTNRQLHDTPLSTGKAPDWLPELARVVAHRELDVAGTVRRIRDVRGRLETLKPKILASPDTPAKRVALTFLALPGERRVSPFSSKLQREKMEEETKHWKEEVDRVADEQIGGDELNFLARARELKHRAFGDSALIPSIQAVEAKLQDSLLIRLSSEAAALAEHPESSEIFETAEELRRFRELVPAELILVSKIRALEDRLPTVAAQPELPSPPEDSEQ